MATVVQKSLQLEEANVKQYCSADGLSLNAGGYAIRKWLNGSNSGYAILNDAAKEVLYPTATSHPFKIDSEIRGSRSAGSMTVNLEFGGTVVHTTTYTSTSLSTKTKTGITDSVVTNSSRDTQIRWNVQGANVNTQRVAHVKLVLYFYQYAMSAGIGTGANGVQSVSVSNSAPYQGDTVTFTPKLVNGATWYGWYSDAACTNLVSTSQSYSVAATDLTLYAKATITATVYSCSAVAGENIASASVSDEIVVSGESATFTAVLNEHCTFDGWFSDSSYTTLVSTANPYTTVITSDTTLYAKGTKISYSINVGTAEHGTAAVSANTAHYGDRVTFTFTPEDETWELYGWYSDEGLTQLVSEDNPYEHSVNGNVTLYPKVGKKRYTITVGQYKDAWDGSSRDFDVISFYYDRLTKEEVRLLRTGEFDNIDQSKIIEKKSARGDSTYSDVIVTILCPFDAYIAIYAKPTKVITSDYFGFIKDSDGNAITYWPYYWYQPSKDAFFEIDSSNVRYSCNCSAIAKDGIDYAYATTPTLQGHNAIFEAEVSPGYAFSGWYSNEACTKLVSTDNPAYVIVPEYTTETSSTTSLTLYAKAIPNTTSTGLYFKQNGAWTEATAVYKKVDGAWAEQTDPKNLFGGESNYIYCGDTSS